VEIRFLGVHNLESVDTKLVSLLIDDVLAVDAGSITTTLSFEEQQRIKSILITHHHFDHIRDLATFGLANLDWDTKNIYSIQPVLDVIKSGLLNGTLYPDLTQIPTPDAPSFRVHAIEEYKRVDVDDYSVLPLPMEHGIPTVGYSVTDKDGKSVFYTSDTTRGIEKCWEHISPSLLVIETTLPDRLRDFAIEVKHMCPSLLAETLLEFKKVKGYIPPTVVVHINPVYEEEIGKELQQASEDLDAEILLGYEGMKIVI
jgi:ribonuclease BN (tRNA processing enzyme)